MIRLAFSDFWPGWEDESNFLVALLERLGVPVQIVPDDADLLIASCFGHAWTGKRARRRIYWTGENWFRMDDALPQLDGRRIIDCFDMVYSFDYNDYPNHYRAPLYLLDCMLKDIRDFSSVIRRKSREQLQAEFTARKFCTFVQGNADSPFRNAYFDRLNAVAGIDSFGPVFNNTGITLDRAGKIEKTREYKFALAFENSAYAGYVTEKLVDALVSDVLPIYWGGSAVASEFNGGSFIDVGALGVQPSLERIAAMHGDFDIYWDCYRQPVIALDQTPLAQRIDDFCLSFERAVRG